MIFIYNVITQNIGAHFSPTGQLFLMSRLSSFLLLYNSTFILTVRLLKKVSLAVLINTFYSPNCNIFSLFLRGVVMVPKIFSLI